MFERIRRFQRADFVYSLGVAVLLGVLVTEVSQYDGRSIPRLLDADIFETVIVIGIIGFISMYLLHRVDRGSAFSNPIIKFSNIENSQKAKKEIAVRFPFGTIAFTILILSGLIWIDWNLTNLADQAYGLMLDGAGGFLLGRQILREPHLLGLPVPREEIDLSSGAVAGVDDPDELRSTVEGAWGLIFLISGFFIQLLSLLPWPRIFSLIG